MSLTRAIELPVLAEAFAAHFRRPNFPSPKPAIIVPSTAANPSLVGTAFDYALRLLIQDCLADKKVNREQRKVAVVQPGITYIYGISGNPPFRIIHSEWIAKKSADLLNKTKGVPRAIRQSAQRILRDSAGVRLFQNAGADDFGARFITTCLQLANLDTVYRTGQGSSDLEATDPDDAADLLALIQNADPDLFNAEKLCLLNPALKAADMVGGADADMVLDDTLIDIKTSSAFELTTKQFYQLLGYLVLSRLGGFDGIRGVPEIKRLGIYFARYNYLYTFPVVDVIQENDLKAFCRWFKASFGVTKTTNSKTNTQK